MLHTLASLALSASSFLGTGSDSQLSFGYVSPPTPVYGTEFHLNVGQTLTFVIQLMDTNPANAIALVDLDLPTGATLDPASPIVVYGNGIDAPVITTTFTWKPTADQAGQHYLAFDAANVEGFRLPLLYTVCVEKKLEGCTRTQGGWGAKPCGNNGGTLLKNNFAAVYPNGVEIGVPGTLGFSVKFTSASAIQSFLPAGGTPNALNADATNPFSSAAGVFAGQVLALQLNVDFSAAGKLPKGPIGALRLCNTGKEGLDGLSIADVLAIANDVLGGGALPTWASSISKLNEIVTNLNEAFDDCDTSWWAKAHLSYCGCNDDNDGGGSCNDGGSSGGSGGPWWKKCNDDKGPKCGGKVDMNCDQKWGKSFNPWDCKKAPNWGCK